MGNGNETTRPDVTFDPSVGNKNKTEILQKDESAIALQEPIKTQTISTVTVGEEVIHIQHEFGMSRDDVEEAARSLRRNQIEAEKLNAEKLKAANAPDRGESEWLPEGVRPAVREYVDEKLSPPVRLGAQIAPSMIGGAVGTAVSPFGGGPISLAAGSAAGEWLGQEIGIIPRDNLSLILAGSAPLAINYGFRIPTVVGKALQRGPAFRQAIRTVMQEKLTLRAREIAKSLGYKPAGPIWDKIDNLGVTMPRENLAETANFLNSLIERLENIGGNFADANSAQSLAKGILDKIINKSHKVLKEKPVLSALDPLTGLPKTKADRLLESLDAANRPNVYEDVLNPELTIRSLADNMSQLGRQIGNLQGMGGLAEGSRKKLFQIFWDEMERIPKNIPTGKAVSLWRAARKATMKENAVDKFTKTVRDGFKAIPGEGDLVQFRSNSVLDRLKGYVDETSELYDKNFSTALADNHQFKSALKFLEDSNKYAPKGAGPGGLIIAGKFAAMGGMVASAFGLPAGIGAIAAVQLPERLTDFLLSRKGRGILKRVMNSGNGIIQDNTINAGTQLGRKYLMDPSLVSDAGEPWSNFGDYVEKKLKNLGVGPAIPITGLLDPDQFLPAVATPRDAPPEQGAPPPKTKHASSTVIPDPRTREIANSLNRSAAAFGGH